MAYGPSIERAFKRLSKLMGEWIETAACPEQQFNEVATLWHEVEQRMDPILETIQWDETFNAPPADEDTS